MICAPSEDTDQLGIRPVWSESSLSAWQNIGSSATHWAHWEDSDQTGWSEASLGAQIILLVLSQGGSFIDCFMSPSTHIVNVKTLPLTLWDFKPPWDECQTQALLWTSVSRPLISFWKFWPGALWQRHQAAQPQWMLAHTCLDRILTPWPTCSC